MQPNDTSQRQSPSHPEGRPLLRVVRVPRPAGAVEEALAATHAGLESAELNMRHILARISCDPVQLAHAAHAGQESSDQTDQA